ncbi:hypothetical protein Y032_0128g1427 [Ancylostoma ceylanicum]|uniref:Uncharacterized protein n=1 Tax=Ancylostoma ceylanicum TaxID=53326 RepID=A0A016T7V5_9BILA|nr:hypothetical protein Y032_0128g1427 [Ancylostoma ceylanicum]
MTVWIGVRTFLEHYKKLCKRDVRSYKYEKRQGMHVWIPDDHKGRKRHRWAEFDDNLDQDENPSGDYLNLYEEKDYLNLYEEKDYLNLYEEKDYLNLFEINV